MDAKLIEARGRIEQMLKELDIAGLVILHNAPGHIEAFSSLVPSYSKLVPETAGGNVGYRLRSKLADYGGDRAAQLRDLEATASMVHGIAEVLMSYAFAAGHLAGIITEATGAEHTTLVKDEGTPQ